MADQLKQFAFSFTFRPAPKSGPSSADAWNDTFQEVSNDLSNISQEWNNKLIPVFNGVPDGTEDTSVNVFKNGLDGKNLWVDQAVTDSDDDLTFYNSIKLRPNTIKEQFDNVYQTLSSQVEELEETIIASSTGLTTDQKNRIGANVFDSTQASSTTSLDGKSERNRLNVVQLANDLYGTAVLQNNGSSLLTNANLYDMVNDLLTLHNSSWNTGVAPSHTGSFTLSPANVTSSYPGTDSFVGIPTDLQGDIDQVRTRIKSLAGLSSWLGSLTALYSGGADSLQDLLTTTQGTGTKTATNPWGYNYSDIDGLNTRLEAIKTFTGQGSQTDTSPGYISTTYIANGNSLELAIGKLDNILAVQSGLDVDFLARVNAIKTFIGQNTDTDNSPLYSGVYVTNGDSLERGIHKLDLQIQSLTLGVPGNFSIVGDLLVDDIAANSLETDANISCSGIVYTASGIVSYSDIEVIPSGLGIILKAPNGVRWRVTINNAGSLTTALA